MHAKTTLAAMMILAMGLGDRLPAATREPSVGFVKGFSWGWPGHRGAYRGTAAERSMKALAATGTRWVALAFAAHVWNKDSTDILYGDANRAMVSDADVRRAVELARENGLKIMLKPTICSHDRTWRAEIRFETGEDWDAWWKSYEAFLLHYARIAADTNCEMFCIGCEMRSMEPFADRWRQLVAKVREVYRGPIVYNTNHDDLDKVAWFDAVDVIGVSAYYPVATAEDASLTRMLEMWKPIRENLRQTSQRWKRPILFAEIGVCSAKGLSATPWASNNAGLPYDGEEQARFYEAAFRSFDGEPWFLGYFWWDWKARLYDREKAAENTDFGVYGKPAEKVLRTWYAKPGPTAASASAFLRVDGDRFVDAQGRQVLLHGMNVVCKSKEQRYLGWHRSEDFAKLRTWGMNCVRLGIIWDAVEPEPSKYDDAYLDGVAQRVTWAAEHGLYVILDMHQDLFSALYGDGAPAWATLHRDKPHRTGAVWSDAYLASPAVQTAFDSFWANAPAPDGVGIQDHYAAAWRHVAKRFADDPTVIGYDLMNEPFQGTSVAASQLGLLMGDFGKTLAERLGDRVRSPLEIAGLWAKPEGRAAIMKELDDVELYRAFLRAQAGPSQAFERERLQPMYERVAAAIREVDRRHILMLEPSYLCNMGVASALEPVAGSDGRRDPRQVYMPHAYDIVVDTASLADANADRLAIIFGRHASTARRLGMPLVIGEWGAFGAADERVLPSARMLQRQIEKRLCGDTYWDYERGVDRRAYFKAINRSIPCRVAGTLLEYQSDPKTGVFRCRWKENAGISGPTIVYVSETPSRSPIIHLEPRAKGFRMEAAGQGTGGAYLSIPPTGRSGERGLRVGE